MYWHCQPFPLWLPACGYVSAQLCTVLLSMFRRELLLTCCVLLSCPRNFPADEQEYVANVQPSEYSIHISAPSATRGIMGGAAGPSAAAASGDLNAFRTSEQYLVHVGLSPLLFAASEPCDDEVATPDGKSAG